MGSKKYKAICDCCGKEFLVASSTYRKLQDGRQKHSYCSVECKSLSQHTGNDVTCANCGKIFYRRKQHINRNENQFCCRECEFEYKHKISSEARICEFCGKSYEAKMVSEQRFCSVNCQHEWQSIQVGELNRKYKRIKVECPTCKKSFMARSYKVDELENGERNNIFCSVICRQKWYKDILCKDEKYLQLRREVGLRLLHEQVNSRVNSKPQIILNSILDRNNIVYEREYTLDFYSLDNYLTEHNLIIEVMGDYWHSHPSKYDYDSLSESQKKTLCKDKAKHTFILSKYGIEILYIWEDDLYNNPDMCEKMILEYVSRSGKLSNYHSFNYGREQNDYIRTEY